MIAGTIPRTTAAEVPRSSSQTDDLAQLHRHGLAVLVASIFGSAASYGFGMFLARMLGAETFGHYALGLTVFNIVALSLVLGLDTALIKWVSVDLAVNREDRARTMIVHGIAIAGLLGLVGGIVLCVLATPIAGLLSGSPVLAAGLVLFAVAIPFASVSAVALASLQGYQTVRPTVWLKYVWEPGGKFLLAAVALAAGWGLLGVLVAIVLTLAVGSMLALSALVRRAGLTWTVVRASWEGWTGTPTMLFATFCLPLAVSNVIGVFAPRSDLLLLGGSATAADVGHYQAAFQTAAVLALVLGAFETGLSPIVGKLNAQQDWVKLQAVYRSMSRVVLTLVLPMFVILTVFAHEWLAVFGSTFSTAAGCLIVLACGQLVNVTAGSASTVLLMGGHSRLVLVNTVALGLLLVVTNALAIPVWGIMGAAVSAASSLALMTVVRVGEVWWIYRMLPYGAGLVKPLLAGALAATTAVGLKAATEPLWWPLVAAATLGVYGATLYLQGLEATDRQVLARVWPWGSRGEGPGGG